MRSGTGNGSEAERPGPPPGGYAAARARLLREGEDTGRPRRAALSRLTDDWLAALLASAGTPADRADAAERPGPPPGTALVAVGGYGRGELSPRSDLDLLLLHDTGLDARTVAAVADAVWYPVWDLGLSLDHSVRTVAQARSTAREDLKVQLGLLDARHLAGDPALTSALRGDVLADWRNQAPRRLPELRELGAERRRRHGDLQFLLEPDLKEAHGGLRDLTALRAVAASWLADAPRAGLDRARARLLDTRDALHLATGRATDRLALQEQDQVAADLALPGADELLRQVYEAARTVAYADEVTWREVGRVLRARSARAGVRRLLPGRTRAASGPGGAAERTPLAEGVVEQDGEAVLARSARPERDPVLPLRAAAAAARAGLPLSPYSVRRLAAASAPLPVPWPAEAREQLVTLLGAGPPAVRVWEALEAEGLVTRLLPDWELVRCRPQRNAVHRWTVDRHLVETAVRAGALSRRVRRPDLLLTAALLHDIGKGGPGDHSAAGAVLAEGIAGRIGLGAADVRTVTTLVRHHLLLVETATRRDLDDPATVRTVADAVGDHETLALLHALTEADALATGPAAWSAWRAFLVTDLVRRTSAVLAGEPAPRREDDAAWTPTELRLAGEALRTGGPVLALSSPRASGPEGSPGPPEPGGAELVVAAPERPGLLPLLAGLLALHRLTVRSAELRLLDPGAPGVPRTGAPDRTGGVADGPVLLLSWRVAAEYGSAPEESRLRADLLRALDGSLGVAARLAERESAQPRRHGVRPPPPQVTVAPATASHHATVLEVRAQDAPGLLHRIGRALEGAGVRLRSAHVSTLGSNAVDAFYLTATDGSPLPGDRAAELARAVQDALS
ncbi:[protein-PII] uridylyltransferase [Streptomyces zingiberis]|uniref:Bifunctional uridylyltransferase/uridylyl-removing enzyme n=1 Tax=Streptomyces zingiberis TaxID=2053010 RepID=A0ABX1C2F8_9ACTN|nr:[protein-PII] uridylyltransferase [Streptomyces zingiberis]NJQ02305.1 [protein-PII] uridylyltransferase [Streptomyces zingiberis]